MSRCAAAVLTQTNLPTIRFLHVEQPGVAGVSGQFDGAASCSATQKHVWLLMIAQQAMNNLWGAQGHE